MTALQSSLFANDAKLAACLVRDADHITQGASGEHVRKIQYALMVLTACALPGNELSRSIYGPQTAKLVKKYKIDRQIINYSYQTAADDIVGKMTIAALDKEMLGFERQESLAAVRPSLAQRVA